MSGMRNYPLLIGAGTAILISGLVGAAAVTGVLPAQGEETTPMERTAAAAAAKSSGCRSCGFVASVREVQVRSDPNERATQTAYRITVRMDDGRERVVTRESAPPYGIGARVRVHGNTLERG